MLPHDAEVRKAKRARAVRERQIESAGVIAFAADVHVRSSDDERADEFLELLAAPELRAVFVLGDMFEFWFEKRGRLPERYRAFLERLKGLGKRLYVIHGNRDFLLGRAFERASGARVLGERVLLKLGKERVLLTHGDEFCRMDVSYRVWRMVSRSQFGKRALKSIPEPLVESGAAALIAASEAEKRRKGREVMSVSLEAVRLEFRRGVDAVVCGHVHEAGELHLGNGRLIKLGSWGGGKEVALWDGRLSLVRPRGAFGRSRAGSAERT